MKTLLTVLVVAVCLVMAGAPAWGQTTYTSTTSGNWSTMTWSPAGTPQPADNVIIADGNTVAIDQAVTIANLTVGQGVSGTLTFDGAAAGRTVVLTGNITVATGGTFITQPLLTPTGDVTLGSTTIANVSSTAGVVIGVSITGTGIPASATVTGFDATTISISSAATAAGTSVTLTLGAATNTLSIGGNVTNNGTIDMSRLVGFSASAVCNITFNNTTSDQFITGSTPVLTRFRGVTLSKGVVGNRVVCSVDASKSGSGTFLLTAGTWEQTAGTLTFSNGNETIPATGALKITGSANFSDPGASIGSTTPFIQGELTVNTTGTFYQGSGNNTIQIGSTGIANFLSGTMTMNGKFVMSGGTTTIANANITINQQVGATQASTGNNAFDLQAAANFTMSGGSVTFGAPNAAATDAARTGRDLKIATPTTGVYSFTGGTFYIGDGATTPVSGGATGYTISVNAPTALINLVIQGGGVTGRNVLLTANLTVNGSLSMRSGTINLNTKTITYAGSRTLKYDGTSTITSTDAEWPASSGPANLVVDNPAGVILHAARTLTGTLTLNSGLLTLGAQNLLLDASSTIGGASSSSYVVTNGVGTLQKTFVADGSFEFPVGDNTGTPEYSPVNVNLTNGAYASAYVAVNVINAKHPNNASTTDYLNRYWTVTQSGVTGFTCEATFHYLPADVAGSEGSIDLGQWNGTRWADLGASNPVDHTLSGIVTAFSDFTGGEPSSLPIQLASFVGHVVNGTSVQLDWTTLSEMNNYGFFVERKSSSEQNFTELPGSFIPGHGTTLEPQHYTFTDNTASAGQWFYRLDQVDLDGTRHLTDPIQVDILTDVKETAPVAFVLQQNYPNPFNPSTEIKFSVEKTGMTTLKVYNVIGQEMATLFSEIAQAGQYYTVKLDASRFSSGIYFYKLESGQKNDMKRMLLLK